MLPSEERLRSRQDFRCCYSSGKSFPSRRLVLYVLPKAQHRRFGFSVSKKVGSAVERNFIKRRLRAICRSFRENIAQEYDMVFIARKQALTASYEQLSADCDTLLHRAGVML